MNLEVGMYCYGKANRRLGIGKIIEFRANNNAVIEYKNGYVLISIDNIVASYNLIDLIDLGDYVNGLVVTRICFDEETGEKYFNMYGSMSDWNNEDIKSIVTKEQFNSMKYEVGE